MRGTLFLIAGIAIAALAPVGCGDSGSGSQFGDGTPDNGDASDDGSTAPPPPVLGGNDGSAGDTGTGGVVANITSMRIAPADATITETLPGAATQSYRVLAVLNGKGPEVDITARSVFYVPDNYLVGGFPANGGPLFTTSTTSPRGGKLTVQAQAANSDGTITTATTSLTVKLVTTLGSPNNTPPLPQNPGGLFTGNPTPARAPGLFYPNDNVMLPPNLHRLEVHWQTGNAANTLFEISWNSAFGSIVYYSRCGTTIPGGCGFELDNAGYTYVAESNRGGAPVQLKIRGTDDTGTAFGES